MSKFSWYLIPHNPAEVIRQTLLDAHYKTYDPFPGGSGSPIGKVTRLRLFISPIIDGWHKVLMALEDTFPAELQSALPDLLTAELLDDNHFQIGVGGQWGLETLTPYLRPDCTLDAMQQAATSPVQVAPPVSPELANLPPDIQQMAQQSGVKAVQVDKMMGKMSKRIMKKLPEDDTKQEQVRAALQASQGANWQSAAGQHLRAVMACLTVPEQWYRPDWQSLVNAYQVARQQQRKMPLLPGDDAMLKQVPDALDYTPLYFYIKT